MKQAPNPANIRLDQLISFWSMASSETYASGREPQRLSNGMKQFVFEEDPFLYEDTWYSIDGRSFGQIMIRIKRVGIIWHMSFEGWMKPEAKQMLLQALRMGAVHFLGGRGPALHTATALGLIYTNETQGDFARFSGKEWIERTDASRKRLEEHGFRGGLLVTLSA